MFIPEPYNWAEPVVIAAIVVFIVSWIGNALTFSNRFANALVTSVVFALIFGAITYFGYGGVAVSVSTSASPNAPATKVMPK